MSSFIQTTEQSESTPISRDSVQRAAGGIPRRDPDNHRNRVSPISRRLYSIRGFLLGTIGSAQLLVDSGASLNLIKEKMLIESHPRERITTKFSMGNDKHQTEEMTILKFQGKKHIGS